jgi:hypothetical protein
MAQAWHKLPSPHSTAIEPMSVMMYLFACIAASAALPTRLSAMSLSSVSGTVVGGRNGVPLANANVTLSNTGHGCVPRSQLTSESGAMARLIAVIIVDPTRSISSLRWPSCGHWARPCADTGHSGGAWVACTTTCSWNVRSYKIKCCTQMQQQDAFACACMV